MTTISAGIPGYTCQYGTAFGVKAVGTVFWDGGRKPEVVGTFYIHNDGSVLLARGGVCDSPSAAAYHLAERHQASRQSVERIAEEWLAKIG